MTDNGGVVPPYAGGSPVPHTDGDEHWGLEGHPTEPGEPLPPIPIMPDPNTPIILDDES